MSRPVLPKEAEARRLMNRVPPDRPKREAT